MTATGSDEVARQARLRAVTLGRLLLLAGLALYFVTLGRRLVDPAGAGLLQAVAIIHLVVNCAALAIPRRSTALRVATEGTTLTDAAAIAVLLAVTGGVASPLTFLLLIEAVAVTLVFGWGGGTRAAVVLSLALFWVWIVTPPALPEAVAALETRDAWLARALDADLRAAWLVAGLWAVTVLVGALNRVAERDLRLWAADLDMLRKVVHELDPRQGVAEVCGSLAATMVDQLGYRGAVVWLSSDEELRATACAGRCGAVADDDAALSPASPAVAPAVAGERPLLVRRADARPDALERAHGTAAPLVLVPLRSEGRLLALISVEVEQPWFGRPTLHGTDLRRLTLLADEASLLLDNARLQAGLQALATTDGLTGLPNHRYLQQRLGEEVARQARKAADGDHRPLSVALFDLDHFKRINDTYGHPTGDAVLQGVSDTADALMRSSDVVCRYGGEEFALVLVDTPAEEAVAACDRLRLAIGELRITAEDGRDLGAVTASFGVATAIGTSLDRAALISGADRALYAAKHRGRNQVMHLDDLDGAPATVDVTDAPRPVET